MDQIVVDPNFPPGLNIQPNAKHVGANGDSSVDPKFGEDAQAEAIETYGIAGRVWEASYAMLSYLDHLGIARDDQPELDFDPPPFTDCAQSADSRTVLELGSGNGLVAARLAPYLRRGRDLFIATDLPDVCALLRKNLQEHDTVEIHPLSWGSYQDAGSIASTLILGSINPLTHIICSDLVYFPALHAPLLRTLLHVTSGSIPPSKQKPLSIIISYKIRSLAKETPFWAAFGLWFSFAPVLARRRFSAGDHPSSTQNWNRFVPVAGEDDTFVFVAHRRPESGSWVVPGADEDLLGGVGAWGTSTHKADDTLEIMLLMSLNTVDT